MPCSKTSNIITIFTKHRKALVACTHLTNLVKAFAALQDFKFILTDSYFELVILTLMAFIADFVMEIILALEIGGFESIRENSCNSKSK